MAYKTVTVVGTPKIKEYKANAALTPGHLVEIMSTGNVRKHATGGGSCQKRFALEDSLQGKEIDDAYVIAERVQTGVFSPGDEVIARLYNGETAVIGSLLESQGDGTLRVVDVDASWHEVKVQSIIGEALEAVDMSGSDLVDPSGKIRIEIW